MSRIYVAGWGSVSPAGWGAGKLWEAFRKGEPLPTHPLARPNRAQKFQIRKTPPAATRPPWLTHARLRRTSPISQHTVAAALEALQGHEMAKLRNDGLGIIVCVFSGCVNYSVRFYEETLRDPATASPLVFPETVFNAPASHLCSLLETNAVSYTLVGDSGTFLVGLATGANWILRNRVGSCLIVGAEEMDWVTAEGLQLFHRSAILADGAGAILLSREPRSDIILDRVTDEILYCNGSRTKAIEEVRKELQPDRDSLVITEIEAKKALGEGLMAGAAWQTVIGLEALTHSESPSCCVSISGLHQHAIGAKFSRA